jgi:NAD(P)-dependent dehydrogenase (short-subunit alcohol dehydrogenase family)
MAQNASSVIVTGATGQLGRIITDRLRAAGHHVIEADLSLGHDFTDQAFVEAWFRENRADSLVNLFALNDAVTPDRKSGSFLDVDMASFRRCMEVNVVALLSVCREYIRNQEAGAIINFSSIYGVVSPRTDLYVTGEKFIGYSVSKAAVIQLTRHLAVHAAPRFRVNCIVPGGVRFDQPDDFLESYARHCPLGRMMEPAEITGIVEYLLSDSASYCTGGVYNVDGGWTAW